jgi:SPP1 gp7 family putative phage head morphogenesis protein
VTFKQQYYDASVRHHIDLLRFGSGVARKVNALLDATRADLRKQVERRLGKVTGITGPSLKRLRELERAIDQQRSGAWNDVTEQWERTAVDVALEEPVYLGGKLTSILPVELDLVSPNETTLRKLATTRPFQGRHLKEWAESAQRADLQRIHQQIRIGMVQGEGSRDIAARVFGERGAMSITRSQAEAVTRTVINGVSNAAQQEFLQSNSDLFDVEQYVATLDSRTTPICRALDGKQFPIGKGPMPPSHVACRSLRVAVLDGEVIGERPFKAGTEQQMLREYAAANGLGKLGSRDDLPRGHKQAFDAFSRRRMRELTGQVPARTTYQEWLKRQPAQIQDDILGPTRGKLFREGGLTLDRFVSREGDELTLDELRQRNRKAFERAGLDRGASESRESALERA